MPISRLLLLEADVGSRCDSTRRAVRTGKATLPLVGFISSAAIRSSVVFPAPLGPSSATNSPGTNFERNAAQSDRAIQTAFRHCSKQYAAEPSAGK